MVAVCCVFEFMRSKDADIVVSHLLPDRWCLHHRERLTNPTFTNDYAMVFKFIRHSFALTFNEYGYSSDVRCVNPIIAGMFSTNIGQKTCHRAVPCSFCVVAPFQYLYHHETWTSVHRVYGPQFIYTFVPPVNDTLTEGDLHFIETSSDLKHHSSEDSSYVPSC